MTRNWLRAYSPKFQAQVKTRPVCPENWERLMSKLPRAAIEEKGWAVLFFFFCSVYSFLSSVFFFLSNIKIFIREKCEKKRVSLTLQRMNSHPWKHTNAEMQTFGTMQDIFSSSLFNWSHPHHSSRLIKKWLFFWNIFPYFQVFRHLSIKSSPISRLLT